MNWNAFIAALEAERDRHGKRDVSQSMPFYRENISSDDARLAAAVLDALVKAFRAGQSGDETCR